MIKLIDGNEKYLEQYKEAYLMSLKQIQEGKMMINLHQLESTIDLL